LAGLLSQPRSAWPGGADAPAYAPPLTTAQANPKESANPALTLQEKHTTRS
jgi:hypothetical protein